MSEFPGSAHAGGTLVIHIDWCINTGQASSSMLIITSKQEVIVGVQFDVMRKWK